MLFPYRDETPARSFPVFTIGLIFFNVGIFLWTYSPGIFEIAVAKYGFTPESVILKPQVLITSIFLHGNWLHLISNMWFLWLFGDNIEDRFGRLPYIGLYLTAGIIGNFTHAFFSGFDSSVPVIGASGAVAGIMGSYLIRYPLSRVRCVFLIIFYPVFFRIHALWLLGIWMIMEFYSAIIASPGDHIAHWAHVGGFISGIVWTWYRRDKYHISRGWWW